ncbi:MAG TPA: radical SAM protein [Kofleriaceae bacterium]|nr:radical SAM protein [Kofleriaceae bacterium]
MRVLLLAGLGPYFKNGDYLDGTLFDAGAAEELGAVYRRLAGRPVQLDALRWRKNGTDVPLLRPPRVLLSHLTAATVRGILDRSEVEHEFFALEDLWAGTGEPPPGPFDLVALSTTFICDRRTLALAIGWIEERYPAATLLLGGQYSNLKWRDILADHPAVRFIIRGDGEVALPRLVMALRGRAGLEEVPNLVGRDGTGQLVENPIEYIDLEGVPSPSFAGLQEHVPYESMRGCPYSCKFCSYPAASPKWRFKSAEKIHGDWVRYAADNGTRLIRAMDSTFTVPPRRFRDLLRLLRDVHVHWEAYARTDDITDAELVRELEEAHCAALSFGFESMSQDSLERMNKRTVPADNLRAIDLLADSAVDYRGGFMVGYPGETPEDYAETHRFLVERFVGRFLLSVFSLVDETMPVWSDAREHRLVVLDPAQPAYAWSHRGMDVATARRLLTATLDEARWKNEEGVLMLWQMQYETPLVPDATPQVNRRVEKLVERLAFLPRDHRDDEQARRRFAALLAELGELGVSLEAPC